MTEDELYHWGIKGMRWGIRRYQNEDGSYTEEGKRRKSKGQDYDPDYWKAHDKKKVEYMSDKELQQRINRINNEKQYKNLTKTKGQKAGDAAVNLGKTFMNVAVTGVLLKMAADYTRKHMPEVLETGKEFVSFMFSKNVHEWLTK